MTSILYASSSTVVIIVIICIFSKISTISSYTKSPPSKALPEIWLTSYDETDSYEETPAQPEFRTLNQFDNQLISKFNRTDYIIQKDVRLVEFTCQAKYPVIWIIPHLKQIENLPYYIFEVVSSRMSDFSQEENPVPRNELFQSVITIRLEYVETFLSVDLTCEETARNAKEMQINRIFSSIYIYFTGKHAIENPGDTFQVYVSPSKEKDNKSEFILPCRPATPNVPILLEKQIEKSKWKKFKYPSKYVKFNPKVGFLMDKNPMGKRSMIFGLYKCTALMEQDDKDDGIEEKTANQQQFIYVNVTSLKDPNMINIENIHFRSNLSLKGDALVMYSQNIFYTSSSPISSSLNKSLQSYDDREFVCCSSGISDKPPMIILDYCRDQLQCKLLKWSMATKLQANADYDFTYISNAQNGNIEGDPKECRTVFLQNSQVVFCEGENVNFADQLVGVFNKKLWPVVNRLEKSKKGKRIHLSTFQAEDNELDNMSRKMFLTMGYPITSRQLDEDNGHYYDQVQYLNFGGIRFNDIDYDVIPSSELRRRTEALTRKIGEYPRDHFYIGEPLVSLCLGWSSFYSDGAYVGVTFKNGTTEIINLHKEPPRTQVYLAGGLVINDMWMSSKQLVYRFGRKIVAHKDMVSIDCWMPEWNTENWDKMSRNLTILEPIPPAFQQNGDFEEFVYFDLGEEGKYLEWTVVTGVPEARIDVTKDGRDIVKRLSSKLDNEDEDNEVEYPIENLFNVTFETDNETTMEDGSGSVIVVKIRFVRKITHEIQGMYQCTVENVGGKVRQSFRVIVAGKRSTILPILFVATVITSLILVAGMGCGLHRQKK